MLSFSFSFFSTWLLGQDRSVCRPLSLSFFLSFSFPPLSFRRRAAEERGKSEEGNKRKEVVREEREREQGWRWREERKEKNASGARERIQR